MNKVEITMLKGMNLCRQYNRLNQEDREAFRQCRLSDLVKWAREKSPFYQELYKNLSPQCTLTDLPPVSKTQLMPRINEWITDPSVSMKDIEAFMDDPDHIGRRYMDQYLVFTTSGSTGNPLVVLCDKTTNNMMGAINTLRSFARKSDIKEFLLRGGKSIGVFATGGEYLSEKVRQELSAAFGCYVQTSYACTEGCTIACECTEHHFHINDDWLIVEPVDQNNQPVADGVSSDKILLTNLFNYTQPFIRYEVTDRVIMHYEPCPCGNPAPWLTLEGRTDDVEHFSCDNQEIRIPPLALYAVLKEVHTLQRFQIIIYADNRIDIRLVPVTGTDRETAFKQAEEALISLLALHRVTNVQILLSNELQQQPGSGKFKHIIYNP